MIVYDVVIIKLQRYLNISLCNRRLSSGFTLSTFFANSASFRSDYVISEYQDMQLKVGDKVTIEIKKADSIGV
jgi:hypothetical protein